MVAILFLASLTGLLKGERGWNKPSPTIELTPTMPPWGAHNHGYSTDIVRPERVSRDERAPTPSSFVFESERLNGNEQFTGNLDTEPFDIRPTVPVPTAIFTPTPEPEGDEGDEL
jgi:hypothetical protein